MPENPSVPTRIRNDQAVEDSLNQAGRLIHGVMVRQLEENATAGISPTAPTDPALVVLETVINGIKNGTDISGQQENIQKLVLNQEQRSELVDNLLLTHDFSRLVRFAKAREFLEIFMLGLCERGDLSAAEALAFMKIVNDESAVLQKRVRIGATSIKDVEQMLSKIDYAFQANEKTASKKYASLSPQAREVIRKLAHKIDKSGKKYEEA